MLDLSLQTEKLARRLAEASNQSVDETVLVALQARERLIQEEPRKDMSPEAIAARHQIVRRLVAEVAALPIIDPRPIQDIVDEINEL